MASRKLKLMSSDGVKFEVDKILASEWQTVSKMTKGDISDGAIPLPKVSSGILLKVIEYSKKHAASFKSEDSIADGNLKAWDAEFIQVDEATLFDLMMAANYLNIPSLLELVCERIAELLNAASVENIRKIFKVTSECTPEEEKELRQNFPWI